MDYLKIRNWDKWQSYRKDRGQPPWIKLHRELLRHPEWAGLTDAQRGQLVAIWLLAADRDGVIPASQSLIQKLCIMESLPDLKLFVDQGFIEHDAIMASLGCQSDRLEAEAEAEKKKNSDSSTKKSRVPYQQIITLYHEKLPELPKLEKLTDKRKSYIRNLWNDDLSNLEYWENFFNHIRQSDFLMGRTEPVNGHRHFIANLEWITKPANYVKIYEDLYHG